MVESRNRERRQSCSAGERRMGGRKFRAYAATITIAADAETDRGLFHRVGRVGSDSCDA